MNNDILDEAEKQSGPRICPECGYQFPFAKFVSRYLMSYGLSKWSCQGCQTLLKCDFMKIQMFGALCGLLMSYIGAGWSIAISLVLYFVFALRTLFYVEFAKYE